MAFTTIHNGWTGWVEQGTWTNGSSQLISRAQFLAETGEAAPSDHTGTIFKVQVTAENTNVKLQYDHAAKDTSSWATVCIRYYTPPATYKNMWDSGYCQLRLTDSLGGSGHARASQENLVSWPNEGMNFEIYDHKVDNSSFRAIDTSNNGGWRVGTLDDEDVVSTIININSNTTANGWVSPLTCYIFDVLRDVGETPINVCFICDDSNGSDHADGAISVHTLAQKHGIHRLTSFATGENIASAGTPTEAEIAAQMATGWWEIVPHSYAHDNYESRSSGDVRADMEKNSTYLTGLGYDQQRGYRGISYPENADEETSDGQRISEISVAVGAKWARRGSAHWYSTVIGADNPMKLAGYPFGQSNNTQWDDHAEWEPFHTQMILQGTSYLVWMHDIVDATPTGTELAFDELDLIFGTIAAGMAAGTVKPVWFSEFAENLGIDIGYTTRRPKAGTRPAAGTRPVAGTRPTVGTRVKAAA